MLYIFMWHFIYAARFMILVPYIFFFHMILSSQIASKQNIIRKSLRLYIYATGCRINWKTLHFQSITAYLKLRLITDEIEPDPDDELESAVEGGLSDLNRFSCGFADTGKDAMLFVVLKKPSCSPSLFLFVIKVPEKCPFPFMIWF